MKTGETDAVDDTERRLRGLLLHSLGPLSSKAQSMFLDVATVFLGKSLDIVRPVWEAWYGTASVKYLQALKERCLTTVSGTGVLGMHDVLAFLGRGIVRSVDEREALIAKNSTASQFFGSRLWVEGGKVMRVEEVGSVPGLFQH